MSEEERRRGGLTGTVIRGVSLAGSGFLLGRAITLVTYIVLARLVTPEELDRALTRGGLTVAHGIGVVYNPLADEWRLSDDTDVNYMMAAARSE